MSAPVSTQNLKLAYLLMEKCELKHAREIFARTYEEAKVANDLCGTMDALAGLLRLAGDARNLDEIKRIETELDDLMTKHPEAVPSMTWYCKGAIATQKKQYLAAQKYGHLYLRTVRKESPSRYEGSVYSREDRIARAWVTLATTQLYRGRIHRAEWLAQELIRRYDGKQVTSVLGMSYLLLGHIALVRKQTQAALAWFDKAHVQFLSEHNWYYHLFVLLAYAFAAREMQNYPQAYWYLELIDKVAQGPEFGTLNHEVRAERKRLEQDAVDLLVDSRRGVIRTRDGGTVSLRKQYVLLHILEALSEAHDPDHADDQRGLSKAELIQKVWHERYRPAAHDNKLYYNINRLRKLIEPDMKQPQYLLNWKEGYRLAPGLRVQWVRDNKGGKHHDKDSA